MLEQRDEWGVQSWGDMCSGDLTEKVAFEPLGQGGQGGVSAMWSQVGRQCSPCGEQPEPRWGGVMKPGMFWKHPRGQSRKRGSRRLGKQIRRG